VLLQVLRPGLRNLGRRLALGCSFDDVDVEILSLAWERIRTYPIDRRPAAIAANVLLDVRKHYIRQVTEAKRLHFEYLSEDLWPPSPSAEHEALDSFEPSLRRAHARLVAAVDTRTISRVSASVFWRTRVQQDDDAEVASELGVGVHTLQRRRQRAERQLGRERHRRLTSSPQGTAERLSVMPSRPVAGHRAEMLVVDSIGDRVS